MVERVEELEELARTMVGDDKTPDVFFVSDLGNVTMITTDFDTAYEAWHKLAFFGLRECALENRTFGVIASVEPDEDGSSKLVVRNDIETYRQFLNQPEDEL